MIETMSPTAAGISSVITAPFAFAIQKIPGSAWTTGIDIPADRTPFASTHSLSLQQTLHAMGTAVLDVRPEVVEVRLSLPNKHHFVVDFSPFGRSNGNEGFHADDRPYGLIEGSVEREGATPAGPAWDPYPLL